MDLRERLAFLEIDDEVRRTLREAKPFIDSIIPSVLVDFYDHVASYPVVATMFSGQPMMDRARGLQQEHWSLIMSARFDDAYLASIKRIGMVHHRVGLEPRWYIGGYSFISSAMHSAVSHHLRDGLFTNNRAKRAAWLSALNKAVLLDIDIALSTYLDAGKDERRGLLDGLAETFESGISSMIDGLSISVRDMEQSASSLNRIANDAKHKAQIVGEAAVKASQNSKSVAASSDELFASIHEISSQIHTSSNITKQATVAAHSVIGSMATLLDQVEAIGQVTEFINSVAGKINLLALNASIESARAGEAGRGFSVVAAEVKNLADQTARASEDIGKQVRSIHESSQKTNGEVREIVDVMEGVNRAISSIAAAIEEQSAVTKTIAQNVQSTSTASNDVSMHITDVEQGAESTLASSESVLGASAHLAEQTRTLHEKVDAFLQRVKTA